MDLSEGEIAVDIAGYEGLYAITNKGRVWGYPRKIIGCGNRKEWVQPAAWQTPQRAGYGDRSYLQVGLSKGGVRKRLTVHKLIAGAFIPNPRGLKQVNHIDGNKVNNAIENLEWCTPAENAEHARRTGLYPNQSSKYRGVSWNRHKQRWVAFTHEPVVGRKRPYRYKYIGQFLTEDEAAAAHDAFVADNLPYVVGAAGLVPLLPQDEHINAP